MGIYQALINVSLDHFAIPGDVAFPLNQAFEPPRDRQDAETLRQYVSISYRSLRALKLMRLIFRYLSQVRQEIAIRLHARLYAGGEGPSKVDWYYPLIGQTRYTDFLTSVVAELCKEEVYGKEPLDC
jgi:hypothetical protein